MLILTLRTDKPEAEIGLYKDGQKLAYETWEAHRQLAETLHSKIKILLASKRLTIQDLEGITVFQGPGSFTGLRIGLSVANALAYGLSLPVVTAQDQAWIEDGLAKLASGADEQPVVPEYGAPVHVTVPKK